MSSSGKQLNLNSIILTFIGCLLGFGIHKLDTNNTQLVEVVTKQQMTLEQLSDMKKSITEMVSRYDFNKEISRLDGRIDYLQTTRNHQ